MSGSEERARSADPGVLRWVVRHLGTSVRLRVALLASLSSATRLGGLAVAWRIGDGLDRIALAWLAVVGALFALKRLVAVMVRLDAVRELHVAVTRSLLEADVLEEPVTPPHIASTEGIYTATNLVAYSFPLLAGDAIASPVAIALCVSTLPPSFLAVVVGSAAILFGGTFALRARLERLHQRALRAHEALAEAFGNALHGRLEIVANGVEDAALEGVRAAARAYAREGRRAELGAAMLGRLPLFAAVTFAGVLGVAALGVTTATWRAHSRELFVLAITTPIVVSAAIGAQEIVRARTRLRPLGDVVLRPHRADVGRARGRAVVKGAPSLAFESVGFAYRAGEPRVLDEVKGRWERGLVVLRGVNGAGKSTALRLIAGLRDPTAGVVAWSDVDLRALDLGAVRGKIAFLPQRPYLGEPYTTVRDAVRIVAPDASNTEMLEALDRVGLRGALAMGEGEPLARWVGDLSVGQRQRLALARVLLRGADVYLLDEPDANLDQAGLTRLTTILRELATDRLVAVAAHGPSVETLGAERWEIGPPSGPTS